jgi:hypothetical protein
MAKRPERCLATSTMRRTALLTGDLADDRRLKHNLLKLRGVLILLAARRGFKMATARDLAIQLKARGLKASMRSLYFWRGRYLRSGFAGLVRRRRIDLGHPRCFGWETLVRIVDAATRVRRRGDLAREFRGLRGAGINSRTFGFWVRRVRRDSKIIEIPTGCDSDGSIR